MRPFQSMTDVRQWQGIEAVNGRAMGPHTVLIWTPLGVECHRMRPTAVVFEFEAFRQAA